MLRIVLLGLILTVSLFSGCSKKGLQLKSGAVIGSLPPSAQFIEFLPLATGVRNRMVDIQNSDGGWDWTDTPENLEASTSQPTSSPNMYGVNALGLLGIYRFTRDDSSKNALLRTITTIMQWPLSRSQRFYATDYLFLMQAGQVFNDSSLVQKGNLAQTVEKEFLAAIHLYGTFAPSAAQLSGLIQTEIDSVSATQLALAGRNRFIAAGRNAGLRSYDWLARHEAAGERGDLDFKNAIAEVVATDFADIQDTQPYYLIGVATSVSILLSHKDTSATTATAFDLAKAQLLNLQESDFSGATVQENAFIARALIDLSEYGQLKKLLLTVKPWIGIKGNFLDHNGKEAPEAQSELLYALSVILSRN